VVAKCITIRGSFVGTRHDMAEALAFAAEGKVKADIELRPLSAINEVFHRLKRFSMARDGRPFLSAARRVKRVVHVPSVLARSA
jgi:D-arabinose 1-dehydrogenase-like Zn-dependent alcohol dehydrogenase